VGVEGEAVHDGAQQPGVGEGAAPLGERGVGGDRDGAAFLTVGEDLEEQFRAGLVQVEVAEFVETKQIDAAVAGDDFVELPVVGGFGEFIDQVRGGGVADLEAGLRRRRRRSRPESPMRQSGCPARTQAGSVRVLTTSGVTFGFAVKSKSSMRFGRGNAASRTSCCRRRSSRWAHSAWNRAARNSL
jgi:hypothetical protein